MRPGGKIRVPTLGFFLMVSPGWFPQTRGFIHVSRYNVAELRLGSLTFYRLLCCAVREMRNVVSHYHFYYASPLPLSPLGTPFGLTLLIMSEGIHKGETLKRKMHSTDSPNPLDLEKEKPACCTAHGFSPGERPRLRFSAKTGDSSANRRVFDPIFRFLRVRRSEGFYLSR